MTKPLALNEIRIRAAQFVIDWRDSPGDERQDAQTFVRALLAVYGITENRAALYEKRAQRTSTGSQGYIDALIPGTLLIEMKSAGKNLGLAEIQALDYMEDLPEIEQPRYVLTSDFKKFRLLDLTAPRGEDVTEWTLEELPRQASSLAFLAGYQTRRFGSKEQEAASIKAARIMADLYESLEGSGLDDHEAGVFLVRTLFALYADDSGVWERGIFAEFIETRTNSDGSDLGAQLVMLYQVMNRQVQSRPASLDEVAARFPYVNGGIFAGSISIPSFDRRVRALLLHACAFDWREISPAIFGSLFQAVKSPEARRGLGEHYTTETNILKTLGPLFLDELQEKFESSQHDAKSLKKLLQALANLRVLDPACGSGNFLIVAYRELRQLELKIMVRMQKLEARTRTPSMHFDRADLAVQLDHVAGIEIEEWPAQIARTALRLVDHQANMAMEATLGMGPETLPLDTLSIIHVGNALRTDWAQVMPPSSHLMIVSNPPFIGHITKSKEQTSDLKHVWGDEFNGGLDYVTAWYKKSADHFDGTNGGRFAFVSTSSITQGQQVPALFRPLVNRKWRVRFAHRTFAWTSEATNAAAVHCVIVGFDRENQPKPTLFTYDTPKSVPVPEPAEHINGYLFDAPDLFVESRSTVLAPGLPKISFGTMPIDGGNLIVNQKDYSEVAADPIAAKYLTRFTMGNELINNIPRWCLWLEKLDPADLQRSRVLRTRIEGCRSYREQAPQGGDAYKYRNTPHLFRPNPNRPKVPYLALPRVFSETRLFATCARLSPDVIAADSVYTCPDPDGFAFSIASSSMFITWQKAVGGRLESRLRLSNTLVWNNLPLPKIAGALRKQIIDAGEGVLDVRAQHSERSLADHYNPLAMAPELLKAHAALDRVVDRAFGATTPLHSNEERLRLLFERYQELASNPPN